MRYALFIKEFLNFRKEWIELSNQADVEKTKYANFLKRFNSFHDRYFPLKDGSRWSNILKISADNTIYHKDEHDLTVGYFLSDIENIRDVISDVLKKHGLDYSMEDGFPNKTKGIAEYANTKYRDADEFIDELKEIYLLVAESKPELKVSKSYIDYINQGKEIFSRYEVRKDGEKRKVIDFLSYRSFREYALIADEEGYIKSSYICKAVIFFQQLGLFAEMNGYNFNKDVTIDNNIKSLKDKKYSLKSKDFERIGF